MTAAEVDAERAVEWLVNRCPVCGARRIIRDTNRNEPAPGYTTRYLECRNGHRWKAIERPEAK